MNWLFIYINFNISVMSRNPNEDRITSLIERIEAITLETQEVTRELRRLQTQPVLTITTIIRGATRNESRWGSRSNNTYGCCHSTQYELRIKNCPSHCFTPRLQTRRPSGNNQLVLRKARYHRNRNSGHCQPSNYTGQERTYSQTQVQQPSSWVARPLLALLPVRLAIIIMLVAEAT